MHVSELKKILEKRNTAPFTGNFQWVCPEDVIGLDREKILEARESEDWSSEEDPSEIVFNYIEASYHQGSSCLPLGFPYTLTEAYVRAMVFLIVKYESSLAATSVPNPEKVTVEEARRCLPFFVDTLLNYELSDYQIETLQMYICDFYQYNDLWDPSEGRFYKEFAEHENILVSFLGNRDISLASLKEHGVPEEIMPYIKGTRLIVSLAGS